MKRQDISKILDVSARKLKSEQKATIRKSRRLALKRKRQRELNKKRASVGEILGLTPGRKNKEATVDEAVAEQVAVEAALRHDRVNPKLQTQRKKASKEPRIDVASKPNESWARRRPRRSYWGQTPPRASIVDMFSTPLPGGEENESNDSMKDDSTMGSEESLVPNTEDRDFINDSTSDETYTCLGGGVLFSSTRVLV